MSLIALYCSALLEVIMFMYLGTINGTASFSSTGSFFFFACILPEFVESLSDIFLANIPGDFVLSPISVLLRYFAVPP